MVISPVRANAPTPAPAPTTSEKVEEIYSDVEGMAHTLHDGLIQTPDETLPMARIVSVMGRSIMGEIMENTKEIPRQAEDCRQAALVALAAGLMAGAADAAVLLAIHELPAAAPKEIGLPTKEDLEKAAQGILSGLKDASHDALVGAGKVAEANGRFVVENSGHFADFPDATPTTLFKACLAETFITGYSVGAIDSALEHLKN